MPESGAVMLVRIEVSSVFRAAPVTKVAHLKWNFGEKENVPRYDSYNSATPLYFVKATMAMGIASFIVQCAGNSFCLYKRHRSCRAMHLDLAQLQELTEKRGTKPQSQVDSLLFGVAITCREWILACLSPEGRNRVRSDLTWGLRSIETMILYCERYD